MEELLRARVTAVVHLCEPSSHILNVGAIDKRGGERGASCAAVSAHALHSGQVHGQARMSWLRSNALSRSASPSLSFPSFARSVPRFDRAVRSEGFVRALF